jgi:hypothetical protein
MLKIKRNTSKININILIIINIFRKKLAEEAKYPKGTRLLSDEEKNETLNNLMNTRKELINLLEKMPITMRTIAVQNRKLEMEKKLEEIEQGIKTFSRKQVFVKIDSY